VIPLISTGLLFTGVSRTLGFSLTDVFVGKGMILISAVGFQVLAPGGKNDLIAIPDPRMRIIVNVTVIRIDIDFLMGTS
jgi:hypothetical protein